MSEELDGLHGKMRALAATGHPRSAELVEKADEFESKAKLFYSNPAHCDVRSFIGAWARARKLWCEITGEPMI